MDDASAAGDIWAKASGWGAAVGAVLWGILKSRAQKSGDEAENAANRRATAGAIAETDELQRISDKQKELWVRIAAVESERDQARSANFAKDQEISRLSIEKARLDAETGENAKEILRLQKLLSDSIATADRYGVMLAGRDGHIPTPQPLPSSANPLK